MAGKSRGAAGGAHRARPVSPQHVSLFEAHGDEMYLDYAVRHRDVIAQYGRFPHRNPFVGRTSTPEEEAYLAEPGAGF